MRRLTVAFAIGCALMMAQSPQEQADLNQTMQQAGNSPVDVIRGLEQFLQKYPGTQLRPGIEKALAKAALDSNDGPRILLYGEKALGTPPDDLVLLDRVIHELVEKGDADSAKKAIELAKRYEADIAALRGQPPQQHLTPGQWANHIDRVEARALALHAEATGEAGDAEEAVNLARQSWNVYPTGEGGRELGDWLTKAGRDKEAIEAYADAFTLADPDTTPADRARDRSRMGSLYAKQHDSEKGLGDLILHSWDRTAALLKSREEALRAKDPNAEATNILDFTLPAMDGSASLPLSSLKGKTVVMDFWATWCVPCRAQHPLIEDVKKRYERVPDVEFVAVDNDDDQSLVVPFLKQQGWPGPVYFEDGLARNLRIMSIPTVLVVSPEGRIASRIEGFVPELFVDQLTQRIEEARLGTPQQATRP